MLHAMAARGSRFRFCVCAGEALCCPAGAIDTFGVMFGLRMLQLLCFGDVPADAVDKVT